MSRVHRTQSVSAVFCPLFYHCQVLLLNSIVSLQLPIAEK